MSIAVPPQNVTMPNNLKTASFREREPELDHITREGIFHMTDWNEMIYANPALLKLLRYDSIQEFNSRRERTIFGSNADETQVRTKLTAGGTITDQRVLLKTSNNGNFWALLSCIPVEGTHSFWGAVIDISSLVESEHSLRLNSNALAKSNMELDRFIYSASHDIRSPISTVMGLVNLINLEPDRDKQMELIGMISVTMNKLDFFLHQLSTHSKNARRDIDVSTIDLVSLVEDALTRLSGLPFFDSIGIITNIKCENFYSDRERLATILFHVLKNAVDFTDVIKREKKIDIQAQVVRNKLVIEIFDNGIGVSDDRVSNVFDMFYKGSNRSVGSGLGLYLVRETVTRLHGVVTLHSKLGVGTVVRIEIPNSR